MVSPCCARTRRPEHWAPDTGPARFTNRIETPLYLAARAAAYRLAGADKKAEIHFNRAIAVGVRERSVVPLLDAYRLGARMHPAGHRDATMYGWLADRLTSNIVEAPSPPIAELLEGISAAPVELPEPAQWLAATRRLTA